MSMRIWYQSMVPFGDLGNYRQALTAHAEVMASPGTEVEFNGASDHLFAGRVPAELFRYAYAKHIIQAEILEFVYQAEAKGFDAIVLGSFSEPFLQQARGLVDIPVVSMPEAAMLASCSLAQSFALITLSPKSVKRVRELVTRHKLEQRVSGVLCLPNAVTERELNDYLTHPDPLIRDFEEAADAAIAGGADAVIPAEGVFNEVLFKHGIHRVGDVPVMDCVGVSILYAEFLVNLRRRANITVGRQWAYARPERDLLDELRRVANTSATRSSD